MKNLEVAAYHGWGFSKEIWQGLAHYTYDRGYFGKSFWDIKFSRNSFKVCIAHSLGLHFIPNEVLQNLDLLIIFGGFTSFREKRVLKGMQRKLKVDPQAVLKEFYINCGLNDVVDLGEINTDLLIQDLDFLGCTELDLNILKNIPEIVVFHGDEDKIVPIEKALNIPGATFKKIPGGHSIKLDLIKQQILKSFMKYQFSQNVETYDSVAVIQKKAAEKLFSFFIKEKIPDGPILEIGAGTGEISKRLVTNFKNVEITDISKQMLNHCQRVLPKGPIFYELDVENFKEENKYSAIIAGMVLQWLPNIEEVIKKLIGGLKEGGILAFSCLGSRSFKEWREICKNIGAPFTGNEMPNLDGLGEREIITQDFPNAIEFFKTLKKLGAGASLNSLKTTDMLKIVKSWKNVKVSYEVIYVITGKDFCYRD